MMELLETMRLPQRIRLTKKMWQDEIASKYKASSYDGAVSKDEAVSSKDEAVSSKDGDASHDGTA